MPIITAREILVQKEIFQLLSAHPSLSAPQFQVVLAKLYYVVWVKIWMEFNNLGYNLRGMTKLMNISKT